MRKTALLFILIFVLASGSAMAGILEIGGPMPSHSWYQWWSENGMLPDQLKPYNKIIITMNEGYEDKLEFIEAKSEGWDTNGNVMSFRGESHIGSFDFTTTFYGNWTDPVSFIYEVFLNDQSLSYQIADWDPDTEAWSFHYPNNCVAPQKVPEPPFSLLLVLGIASAGFATLLGKN